VGAAPRRLNQRLFGLCLGHARAVREVLGGSEQLLVGQTMGESPLLTATATAAAATAAALSGQRRRIISALARQATAAAHGRRRMLGLHRPNACGERPTPARAVRSSRGGGAGRSRLAEVPCLANSKVLRL
jgi:hypothetical protein